MWINQISNYKVLDFATAFWVRKHFGTFMKRTPGDSDYFLYNPQSCRDPRDQKAHVVKMPLEEVGQDPQEIKEMLVSKVKRVQR